MKASKFSDAQKAFIVRQGEDGTPVAEICRKAGISQATYFNWKKKYAGMMPSEMKRMRELESENARLKRIVCASARKRNPSPIACSALIGLDKYQFGRGPDRRRSGPRLNLKF